MGKTGLPLCDSLPGNADPPGHLFLGQLMQLPQDHQILGDFIFLHFHTFHTSWFDYTLDGPKVPPTAAGKMCCVWLRRKGGKVLALRRFCRRQGCEAPVPYDRAGLGLAMDTKRKAPLCARTVENAVKAYPALREAALLPFPAAICVEMRGRCLRVLCQPGLTISCCRTNGVQFTSFRAHLFFTLE